jgi:hypothetical protein
MRSRLKNWILGAFALTVILAVGCGNIDPDSTHDGRDPSELEPANGSQPAQPD